MKAKHGPPLFSEGDEGEWAMVKMVRGKLPIPSFSAKAGNPKRQSVKNGPPLFSEGDEGEWAMVTKVRGCPHSVILCESRESKKTISQEWTPRFAARVTKVSGRW
jgi:hypothetical protein